MSKGKGKAKSGEHTCSGCKNFKAGKNGSSGRCTRSDKKRSAADEACGHYDPLKRGK